MTHQTCNAIYMDNLIPLNAKSLKNSIYSLQNFSCVEKMDKNFIGKDLNVVTYL